MIIYGSYFLTELFFEYIECNKKYFPVSIKSLPKTNIYSLLKSCPAFRFFMVIYLSFFCVKSREKIVCFDLENIIDLIFIRHCYRDTTIRLWLWNPLRPNRPKTLIFLLILKLLKIKAYSFDKENCKKYNLQYHNQIFNANILTLIKPSSIKPDVFFLGVDKLRLSTLEAIAAAIPQQNVLIKVIKDKHTQLQSPFLVTEGMSYFDYLAVAKSSNCLIDIPQKNQSGITLRTLEAMFLNKKLITNNLEIKKYDFYSAENIFVWGVDDIDKLSGFIKSPSKPIPQKILAKYDLGHLLNFLLNS